MKGATLLCSYLKSIRSESKFNEFYDHIVGESAGLTEEPCLPRQRKVPRRLDDGSSGHVYANPRDRYRQAYFEAIDLTLGEVDRRFKQSDISKVRSIESLLLEYSNGKVSPDEISEDIQAYLKDDIDLERMKAQLLMLHDAIKTSNISILKVTNVRTIADVLNANPIFRGMLNEIDKLLKIYFTFPVTSVTSERSFSSLRKIKTYLRSTMSECRLNNLFLLYIHQSKTDELNLKTIVKKFVSVNLRRANYFGKH